MIIPATGDWIAAVYDDKWYVGEVLEVDKTDGDANVSFMHSSSKNVAMLKKPNQPDELWVMFGSILAIFEPPCPHGKTRRQFKLNSDTVDSSKQNGWTSRQMERTCNTYKYFE